MIKYLLFILLSFSVYSQNNEAYTKMWGTYFGPQLGNFRDVIEDADGNLIFFSPIINSENHIPRNVAYMNQFVTEADPRLQFNLQNFLDRSSTLVAKFSPEGTLLSSFYLPYLITQIEKDTNGNYVFLGNCKNIPEHLVSSWYPNQSNQNEIIGKLDRAFNLIWFSYIPTYGQVFTLDQDNAIYLGGTTTIREGITTVDSFLQNPENISALNSNNIYLVKLLTDGSFSWSTYYGTAGVVDLKILNNELVVALLGNSNQGLYATQNALFTTPSNCVISKFNKTTGGRNYSTYLKDFSDIVKVEVVDNFIYLLGLTFNNLDATLINLNTIPTPEDNMYYKSYFGKFSAEMNPIWGTYILPSNIDNFHYAVDFIYHDQSFLLVVVDDNIEQDYDETLKFLNLTENNQQLTISEQFDFSGETYYSYYNRKFIHSYDSNSLYIFGSSNTNTGIATPGSFQETISISPQYPLASHGNAFVLNYKKTSSLNLQDQNLQPFIIYPNPSTGTFYFKNNSFKVTSVAVYNMLGQMVYQTQNTNIESLQLAHLSKGIYTIQINNQNIFYKISIN